MIQEIIGMTFLLLGMVVIGISLLGFYRFHYIMERMHAGAVSDTMGVLLCMIGLAVLGTEPFFLLKLILVVVFFWLTSPVASHMIAKVELLTNQNREERMEDK